MPKCPLIALVLLLAFPAAAAAFGSVSPGTMGIQTSSLLGNLKPSGMTPTTVRATPPRRMVRPTTFGSPGKSPMHPGEPPIPPG